MLTLKTVGKPKMVRILSQKQWVSPSSFSKLNELNPKMRNDLCTIVIDAGKGEPDVFEVLTDVFRHKPRISLSEESITELKEVLGTLEIKSNPELMECIQQSQIDKKKGDLRKYEDIARECGLMP